MKTSIIGVVPPLVTAAQPNFSEERWLFPASLVSKELDCYPLPRSHGNTIPTICTDQWSFFGDAIIDRGRMSRWLGAVDLRRLRQHAGGRRTSRARRPPSRAPGWPSCRSWRSEPPQFGREADLGDRLLRAPDVVGDRQQLGHLGHARSTVFRIPPASWMLTRNGLRSGWPGTPSSGARPSPRPGSPRRPRPIRM